MDVRIGLVSLGLGVAIETVSLALGWWIYHPPWLRVVNVLLVFGIAFGWLASTLAAQPAWRRFAVGAAAGIGYETLNLLVLQAWSFPGDRLLLLHGPLALVLGVGAAWGVVPLFAPLVAPDLR
jgi:hypothetical protein